MTRTSLMALLVVLAGSGAMAQTADKIGDVKLDPGSSGGTAGLISGGGTVSYNFDGRDARSGSDTRSTGTRMQTPPAKAGKDVKDPRMTEKAQTKAARARAEADNEQSGNKQAKKEKKQQQQRTYGYNYPYVYPYGFGAFGSRSYMRSRD